MNNLREIRLKYKKSQSEIAEFLSISQQAYGYYEREERSIPVEYLCKLADHYKVSTDYLLKREELGVNYSQRYMEVEDVERAIIINYRNASKKDKGLVTTVLDVQV